MSFPNSTSNPHGDGADSLTMYGPDNDRLAVIYAATPLVLPGGMAPMGGDELDSDHDDHDEAVAAVVAGPTPRPKKPARKLRGRRRSLIVPVPHQDKEKSGTDDDDVDDNRPTKKRKTSAETRKSKADAKAGKQRDELKRQNLLREHRGFACSVMGIGDMKGLTTVPEMDEGGVVGVVSRAVEDCNITDPTTITYIEDQVKDFLERKFKTHFGMK